MTRTWPFFEGAGMTNIIATHKSKEKEIQDAPYCHFTQSFQWPTGCPWTCSLICPTYSLCCHHADSMLSLKHRRLLRPGCLRAFALVAMAAQNTPPPVFQIVHSFFTFKRPLLSQADSHCTTPPRHSHTNLV